MLLVVGRIGRAHGVLGEATVEIRTDLPEERFFVGNILTTDPANNGPLTIESVRFNNGIMLLKFRESADRTQVERLRDTLLFVDVDVNNDHREDDSYHVQQLIGLAVVNTRGEKIGTIDDVLNLPGQDLLVINSNDREILLPFIVDFVPVVDLLGGLITVTPPTGLFDHDDENRLPNE